MQLHLQRIRNIMQGQSISIFSITLFENTSKKTQSPWSTAKQQRWSQMRSQSPSRSTDIRNWSKEWDYVGSKKHYAITNLKQERQERQKLEKWECWIIPSYLQTMRSRTMSTPPHCLEQRKMRDMREMRDMRKMRYNEDNQSTGIMNGNFVYNSRNYYYCSFSYKLAPCVRSFN